MLHTSNPASQSGLGLSNVSKTCKITEISHDAFYRYRELGDEDGVGSDKPQPSYSQPQKPDKCGYLKAISVQANGICERYP